MSCSKLMSMPTFILRFTEADLCLQTFNVMGSSSAREKEDRFDICAFICIHMHSPMCCLQLAFPWHMHFCDPSVLNFSRRKLLFCHTLMGEPSLEQVLPEALRQYEKQARIYAAARQSRPERNRHVAAQVTQMVIEK